MKILDLKKGLFAATLTMSAAQLQAVTPVDFQIWSSRSVLQWSVSMSLKK